MTTYRYTALETPTTIRLVELLHSEDESSPLLCRIHHVDLSHWSRPPYTALSYVWGSEDDPDTITVLPSSAANDSGALAQEQEQIDRGVRISRNLSLALRCIRKALVPPQESSIDTAKAPTKWLQWVDAICIDQSDSPTSTAEKQTQIPLMGKIYSLATTVVIYLGPESVLPPGVGKSALECIDMLWTQVHPRIQELKAWVVEHRDADELLALSRQLGAKDPGVNYVKNVDALVRAFNIAPPDESMYEALNQLLELPWFRRVWTFQESFLARARWFLLGEAAVPGEVMENVINIAILLVRKGGTDFGRWLGKPKLPQMIRVAGREAGWVTLDAVALLMFLRGSDCKLGVDMVYGLLGVLDTYEDVRGVDGVAGRDPIKVDYSRPVSQVFGQVVVREILKTGRLTALGLVDPDSWWSKCGDNQTQQDAFAKGTCLPSWVPDWREMSNHRWFSTPNVYLATNKTVYIPGSTGTSRQPMMPSHEPQVLKLTGISLDVVATVAPREMMGMLLAEVVSRFPTLRLNETGMIYLPTGEKGDIAAVRTKCADIKIHDEDEYARVGERWDADSIGHFMGTFRNETTRTRLVTDMMEINKRACLFATEGGKLGLAPLSVRAGDVVCLALGADVPLLLRECESDVERKCEGKYRFVGESYLHGFMDGEGLIEARKRVDPSYDGLDKEWLMTLHDCKIADLPFETTEFCIC
ncbi:heterokaryon incompatibility protein-domain-containing protein [Rhypophila decipiens]|uniref:Heterokaryon incompatibility protein-domain-containing protein n=1 Tax=Rhypophila decipiens TaxID=261697 RepID=A0AAN6Y385_9PEZI|nr:heterokaryon incompatibility protein-domain-containing protein [Rhypophila decipiens]